MKLYRDYPFASISFADDPELIPALDEATKRLPIDVVIETGTFLGKGSTRILADYFMARRSLKRLLTMEVNWEFWQQAKQNLKHYGFVDLKWGASVNRNAALDFIRNDPMIKNHAAYDNIFIDDVVDPVTFYSNEVMGSMNGQTNPVGGKSAFDLFWEGEDLLKRMLYLHRLHAPLVVLDSAGGVGYLEFQNTLQVMGDQKYALLLDDTHHIKHYRSLQTIKNDKSFEIIQVSEKNGWALALHTGH